ncbi:energy-coupling factor ABC transporter permease [Reinekea blandensis]|uniref:Cobalt transport protein CbiM n=1 Tax=Reinekea blandensis MED297 TaxID=314283 RepID=A4BK30_9GAMM|nr:energy-coupling factor ABC transporter permease [Reinekea blandensis]EAR07512.1 hypothetical protein MED297_06629 [Reinekea sp. MED297] [Reinekea blandensis MED297]
MNLTASTLPFWLNLTLNGFFILTVFLAITHLPWRELKHDASLQHRLGFTILVLVLIWSLRAGVSEGLGIHFFLMTGVHLMFGWSFAILLVALVQCGLIVFGVESVWALGINGISSGVIPILVTFYCWKASERGGVYNPFVFIFGVAFAGAMLAILMSAVFVSVIFLLTGLYDVAQLRYEFWAYLPLIALPEGIINGMLIAAMIVFKPHWVRLFDEKKYYGTK